MLTRFDSQRVPAPGPIPARAGIGLRAPHHAEIIASRPAIGWIEAHTENYFVDGGGALAALLAIRADYPVSLHGVGLSLGSTDPLAHEHLDRIASLVRRVEPALVSEHLSWSAAGGRDTNDLLPLPYTEEALRHVCARISAVQERLGRQILVENVSSYLQFRSSELTEWEFVAAVASETGCGLLLDVNNIYVSAMNHGFDPLTYLLSIPRRSVKEIHLAGHSVVRVGNRELRIDTHGAPVCDAVWHLYARAISCFGRVATLIEWDTDIPSLDVLVGESRKADRVLEALDANAA